MKNFLTYTSYTLMTVGALNWGLVGLCNLDLVATLFSCCAILQKVVYILIGLSGLHGVAMMCGIVKCDCKS